MANNIKPLIYSVALLLVVGLSQAVSSHAETAPATSLLEGTVVEVMNSDGYTYVGINSNGQIKWATTRGAPVEIGDQVEIASGSVITEFESAALGRTFDEIIFTNTIVKQ